MSDESKLVDTALPFPLMFRIEEHPQAFKLMVQGHRVPQVLKLWMNFKVCLEIQQLAFKGVVAMDRSESGIYGFGVTAMKMQQGHEPKLVDDSTSKLVAPGGVGIESVLADEAKKEKEEEKTDE